MIAENDPTAAINKLPQITAAFWVMKIAATTLGETGGDWLSMTMNLGYLNNTLIFFALFLIALATQLAVKQQYPFLYWMVIVATSTAGTTMSDYVDRTLELGYAKGAAILVTILLSSLALWRFSVGTMPELPDIVVYVESLEAHLKKARLEGMRLKSLFLLRTAVPPLTETYGRAVTGVPRIGKRIHEARLSPMTWTSRLSSDELARLHKATIMVLNTWTQRLRAEAKPKQWPPKVTAFREGMAVHGRYNQPCPVCGTAVQRVVYADNEMNYSPTCQTDGKLLADRLLSTLMRGDWPKTLAELDERKQRLKAGKD